MRRRRTLVVWGAVSLLVVAAGGCRLYNLERKLDPVNADFLSKVRYVITSQERKIFLELPDSEKPQFIEEFWQRRDPDPSTPENEFKMEYFNRIEYASKMFIGEGRPGWLTDRGRIYVLFGPPTDRITQPSSGDAYNRCQEVWYYGNFPVVFYDETCSGTYRLVTYELSGLRDLNLMYMHELNMAQAGAQKTFTEDKKMFDFNAELRVDERAADRLTAVLLLDIAYERIWYKSEGKTLFTTLDAAVELRDAGKNLVWDGTSRHDVKIGEAELVAKTGKFLRIEIPIEVRDPEKIKSLGRGQGLLFVTLKNSTGQEALKKALNFR
jgi:GWxTD domain-containing protein